MRMAPKKGTKQDARTRSKTRREETEKGSKPHKSTRQYYARHAKTKEIGTKPHNKLRQYKTRHAKNREHNTTLQVTKHNKTKKQEMTTARIPTPIKIVYNNSDDDSEVGDWQLSTPCWVKLVLPPGWVYASPLEKKKRARAKKRERKAIIAGTTDAEILAWIIARPWVRQQEVGDGSNGFR